MLTYGRAISSSCVYIVTVEQSVLSTVLLNRLFSPTILIYIAAPKFLVIAGFLIFFLCFHNKV